MPMQVHIFVQLQVSLRGPQSWAHCVSLSQSGLCQCFLDDCPYYCNLFLDVRSSNFLKFYLFDIQNKGYILYKTLSRSKAVAREAVAYGASL